MMFKTPTISLKQRRLFTKRKVPDLLIPSPTHSFHAVQLTLLTVSPKLMPIIILSFTTPCATILSPSQKSQVSPSYFLPWVLRATSTLFIFRTRMSLKIPLPISRVLPKGKLTIMTGLKVSWVRKSSNSTSTPSSKAFVDARRRMAGMKEVTRILSLFEGEVKLF